MGLCNRDAVLQAMPSGILIRRGDDRIIDHNPAAERLLALTFEQMRGLAPLDPTWRLVRADGRDLPSDEVPSRLTLRDGRARQGLLLGVVTAAAPPRWLSFDSEPLLDAGGRVISAISTFTDVSTILSSNPPFPEARPGGGSAPEHASPTLAGIAQRLGVTTATVSMALHDHPRISAGMREKVKAVATEVGYRPDPRMSHAMMRVRKGRKVAFRSVIHALTDLPSRSDRNLAELIDAAKRHADRLGYGFEVGQIGRAKADDARLNHTLLCRGVEGLLLLPMAAPWHSPDLLEWSRFSVVAAYHSVQTPDFDRVTGDVAAGVRGVFAQLAASGYRRIGAVINVAFDEVVHHHISAALMQARSRHAHVVEPYYYRTPLVSALECVPGRELAHDMVGRRRAGDTTGAEGAALKGWFDREQPDALVVDCENVAEMLLKGLGLSVPGEIGVAVLKRASDSQFAGWEERAALVGEISVDLLDRKIRAFDRGEPHAPTTKLVKGLWRHAPSVRGTVGIMPQTG